MAELAAGDPRGIRRLAALESSCAEARVRHIVLTAYVISGDQDGPRRVVDLAVRMRADGQDDVVVGFREAVARRRLGDLAGALSAIDRALHELATGTYDRATRTFVNEQLRQERERVLDRLSRDGWTSSVKRTIAYGQREPTRGGLEVDVSEHVIVTIQDIGGAAVATGELSLSPRARGDAPGTVQARLRAPLWAVSLGHTISVELPDGSLRSVRVRDVTSMEGTVAMVNVELVESAHRTVRTRTSPDAAPTRRSSPA